MEFHAPGRPEDLPPFGVLWARAAALAALEAGGSENQHVYADAVVHHDDGGGNEWQLARIEGGRGVLVGVDHECGYHMDIEGYDPYAGPDWLPWTWFTALENNREQGFAYWWGGSSWDRIDYPDLIDNDGLDLLLTHLSTAVEATEKVLEFLDLWPSTDEWEEGSHLVHRVLQLAEQGTSIEEGWRQALDAVLVFAARKDSRYLGRQQDEFDISAALAVARATGLVKGFDAGVKPAGHGRPQGWVPRLG
ncbi:hypothetical protein Q8791_17275 [Nocardiopsis sp. CT-R113]|uniref:Uncharacterized protein n=1 Tax=Nocardiopsis codii TaxID=3065942 RepID=A0ABU7K9Q5_9ACTN|nr:hypothetical protein [Nocardiopsis sp. CT-R113]MEE2038970.1 hypothetical protein [Nocardiopsis sp. CT-R113]